MNEQRARIDQSTVSRRTYQSKRYSEKCADKALRAYEDLESKQRLSKGRCATCYYLLNDRVGGAVITRRPCGICGQEMVFGSTATDKICQPCALKHELCRQCGGDVHLRLERVFTPPDEAAVEARDERG